MENKPLILAIETTLQKGSLAIFRGELLIESFTGQENVSRTEDLLGAISALLIKNDLRPKEIDLIAVSTGPGSFTGIRIGIATAQALTAALECSCVGVSILEALGAVIGNSENFVTAVPLGRDRVYWQLFSQENDLKKLIMTGNFNDFIEAVNDLAKKQLIVITPGNLYKELSSMNLPVNKNIKFETASDNVSAYIAHLGRKKYLEKKNIKNLVEVSPEYILDVEIGRSR